MIKDFSKAKTDEYYNRFYARGRVVGYGLTPSGMRTFVLFIRGNGTDSHKARNMFLNIAYGRDVIDSITGNGVGVPVGTTVEVEGRFVGILYRNEAWGRSSYIQYMVADKLETAGTEMEDVFGTKGFSFGRPYTRVYFKGYIRSANVPKEGEPRPWTMLTIRTGQRNTVRVQCSERMRANDVAKLCRKGDYVCMIGIISTVRKERREGGFVDYENIIIDDIQIIRKAENGDEAGAPDKAAAAPSPEAAAGTDNSSAAVRETPPAADAPVAAPAPEGAFDANEALMEVMKNM